jgi:hypothetical protein
MLVGLIWLAVLYLLGATLAPRRSSARPSKMSEGTEFSSSQQSWLDPALGRAVTMITHQDNGVWGHNSAKGRVRCWSRSGWSRQQAKWSHRYGRRLGALDAWRGFTTGVPRKEIELPPNVCGELSTLENDPLPVWRSDSPYLLAYAVGVLAHEARHFSGAIDEWSTECYGMQSIRDVAVQLGRTPKEGHYLASLYWKQIYQRESPRYRMPQCRNGGEFDLRLHSSVWP